VITTVVFINMFSTILHTFNYIVIYTFSLLYNSIDRNLDIKHNLFLILIHSGVMINTLIIFYVK